MEMDREREGRKTIVQERERALRKQEEKNMIIRTK